MAVAKNLSQYNSVPIIAHDISASTVTGQNIEFHGMITVPFLVGSNICYHRFYVVDDVNFVGAVLIGTDFFTRFNVNINYGKNKDVSIEGVKFSCFELQQINSFESVHNVIKLKCNSITTSASIKVVGNVRVPPNCTAPLLATFSSLEIKNSEFLVEPIDGDLDYRIARSIHSTSNGKKFNIAILNASNEEILFKNGQIVAQACPVQINDDNVSPSNINVSNIQDDFKELDNNILDLHFDNLNCSDSKRLKDLLRANKEIFSTKSKPIGDITIVQHELDTPPGEIVCVPQYRQPHACKDIIETMVKEMLEAQVVKECQSPWNNPVLLTKKKDGTWRFCIDFRKLNALTPLKPHPIPKISETLDSLVNMKYFSTLDAKSGYFHVALREQDQLKTAFRTGSGTFCFLKMPFGLKNSGFTYQLAMSKLLMDVLGKCSLCYIDDVVIFSPNFDQHLLDLQKVFSLIKQGGVKLAFKKCKFAANSIKYLGFMVDGYGISPDPEKIFAIKNYPTPTNIKQIRQFLASVGFYRNMISDFAELAAPLSDLLRKNVKWQWSDACQSSFEALRDSLSKPPILRHPNFHLPFEIHTDASKLSIAGVLMQRYNDTPFPIAYFSRKLRPEETRYSVTELEALAIVASIKHYHYYVYNTEFVVVTDHMPLKTIFDNKSNNSRINRWSLFLLDYSFTCRYKSGQTHHLPDALSRNIPIEITNIIAKMSRKEYMQYLDCSVDYEHHFSKTNVIDKQVADPRWSQLRSYLSGEAVASPPPRSSLDEFVLDDNVLKFCPRNQKFDRSLRLVIPKSLISYALHLVHNSYQAAHNGFVKTLHRARDLFYWPNMAADIKAYVSHCLPCQKRKPGKVNKAPLGEFEEVTRPMQRLGVDLIGKLDITEKGNLFILTIVDHFSRYLSLYALPSKSAADVADAFADFSLKNGAAETVVSDQGSEFTSEVFKDVCRLLKAKTNFTTIFHPQANGLTENRNRYIADILSFLVLDTQKDWDDLLPYVSAALNTAYHASIQDVPFYIFHGRDYNFNYSDILSTTHSYAESPTFSAAMQKSLAYAFKRAAECHKESTQRNAIYYNRRSTNTTIDLGDLVLIRNERKTADASR